MLVEAAQNSAGPCEAAAKDGPVSADREEPNKILGMPRGYIGPHAREDEEPRHVLGVPADWYEPVNWDWLRSLRHPIKACKRSALRRRLGPYAPDDEDDPASTD